MMMLSLNSTIMKQVKNETRNSGIHYDRRAVVSAIAPNIVYTLFVIVTAFA